MNKTRFNTNRLIRESLGITKSTLPVAGDRLICCQNDSQYGLFNGMIGTALKDTTDADHFMKCHVFFESDSKDIVIDAVSWKSMFERTYNPNIKEPEFNKLTQKFDYAYCLTCHKSQGSEWENVTVIDESDVFRDDKQKWLYTAITRASKTLVLVR